MRVAMVVALTATVAGCVSSPTQYEASLSQQDPKWATPECQKARADVVNYGTREKEHPGWGSSLLLGPYSMALVAAIKENEQKQRRLLARQVHLQCSSLPLPRDLDFDPKIYAPRPTPYR
jgi:hypothetical protein